MLIKKVLKNTKSRLAGGRRDRRGADGGSVEWREFGVRHSLTPAYLVHLYHDGLPRKKMYKIFFYSFEILLV